MPFAIVTQDGDVDGYMFMSRMPTKAEAEVIRSRLAIPKRRTLSDEHRARLSAAGRRFQPCAQKEVVLSA